LFKHLKYITFYRVQVKSYEVGQNDAKEDRRKNGLIWSNTELEE